MKKAKKFLAVLSILVLLVQFGALAVSATGEDAAQWIGLGGAQVTNGNTVTNGRMYYDQKINLTEDGVRIKFTINEIPAYNTDTGADGWIGLYISADNANPDNYGNFLANDGFQFLLRGLTASEDESVAKIRTEMSVAAGNFFGKGSYESTKTAVGEHEIILYSKGKNEGGLDVYAGFFDGIPFADDAEGFLFENATISIGMNLLEGQNGSITINSVESYDPNTQEAPEVDPAWISVGGSTVTNGNTVANGRMYYNQKINLTEDGVRIKFVINEIPAYNTDTGADGWIGLYISENAANPDNYGNYMGNNGFQFLLRGLTASEDESVAKIRTEMSVAAGNWFGKGSYESTKPAVGEHEIIFYSKGKNAGGLDVFAGYFDGVPFDDDAEGFLFNAATISIGMNLLEGQSGSITILSVESYDPNAPVIPEPCQHSGGNATCQELAVCEKCGEAYGELGSHTEKIVPGKEATCEETGLTEGKVCEICNEILVAQEEIAAKGHSYVDGVCEVCSNPKTGDFIFLAMMALAVSGTALVVFPRKKIR